MVDFEQVNVSWVDRFRKAWEMPSMYWKFVVAVSVSDLKVSVSDKASTLPKDILLLLFSKIATSCMSTCSLCKAVIFNNSQNIFD